MSAFARVFVYGSLLLCLLLYLLFFFLLFSFFPCSVFSVLFHSSLLCLPEPNWTKLNVNLSAFLSLSHRVFTLFHSMVCVMINTYLNYLHAHTKQKINRRQSGRRSVSRLCSFAFGLFFKKSICGPLLHTFPIFCTIKCETPKKHKFIDSKTFPKNTAQMTAERNENPSTAHRLTCAQFNAAMKREKKH